MKRCLLALLVFAASPAWARNWQLVIDSLACDGAVVAIGARIRYLGVKAPGSMTLADRPLRAARLLGHCISDENVEINRQIDEELTKT